MKLHHDNEDASVSCPVCEWQGTLADTDDMEGHDGDTDDFQLHAVCPKCGSDVEADE